MRVSAQRYAMREAVHLLRPADRDRDPAGPVPRPGIAGHIGRLLVADFRPSGGRFSLHAALHSALRGAPHGRGHARQHATATIEDLAAEAGFQVLGRGGLPMLSYVQAARPLDAA
jgi:hypothetical protein